MPAPLDAIQTEPHITEEAKPPVRMLIGDPVHRYPLLEEQPQTEQLDFPDVRVELQENETLELRISLEPDEAVWGFGQRFDAFNMRGRRLESWATDGWNNLNTSYFAVPFFISSRGYGLFVNCTGRVRFDIGASHADELVIEIPEDSVELITFYGDPATISRSYTELVGRPQSAPEWIYRPWMSRNSYLGAYEINRMLRRMHELEMPVGVVVLEAWAEQLHNFRFEQRRYSYPITWMRDLNQQGVHVVCWITSSVWPGTEAYRQAKEHGYLVLNEDGSEHVVRWLETGRKIDFRVPQARAWWRDLQRPLVEMGVSGIKTDGGEHMPDPHFHNEHPYYYQKASLDAFRESEREGITFSRSGNPLTAGLSVVWAGDQHAEWSRLEAVVRAGLSAALSGYPLWGHDIGAYSGIPEKNLYIRWLQFGVFSPIMQFHGIEPREPWHYDEETLDLARFYFAVRERLLPFLKAWGDLALEEGIPIIRPLIWHFPDDPVTYTLDDQYMLGPDLLVAPTINEEPTRAIYLPEGVWIDAWNGTAHSGPAHLDYEAALHQIPVFVRAEAHHRYATLFDDAPRPRKVPVLVELVSPHTAWGVPPDLLYFRNNAPAELEYRITNRTDDSVPIGVRLAVPAGIETSPRRLIRFSLAARERRSLHFTVTAPDHVMPGTYPLKLEARRGARDIPAPTVSAVVSPTWRALGLFEGGVGSEHTPDEQPVDYETMYEGRNGTAIGWREIPETAMRDDGLIDVGNVIGADAYSTSYLHTTLFSPWPRRIRFFAGSGDALTVWVNGRELHHLPVHRNPERDEDVMNAVLTGGRNQILVRIGRDLGAHHFYFRAE